MISRITLADDDGRMLAPSCNVDTISDGEDLADELLNWTHARPVIQRLTVVRPLTGTSSAGNYQSVLTVAQLEFGSSTTPGRLRVIVPAPKSVMFLGDGETVDPSAAAALIAAFISYGRLPSGAGVDTYLKGHRRQLQPSR